MRGFLVAVAILAVAIQPPQSASGDDRDIADQIVQTLESAKADGNLRDFNIGLHVVEGVVCLSGYVASHVQQKLAIDAAREAEGVREVLDEIEVIACKPRPAASPAGTSKPTSAATAHQEIAEERRLESNDLFVRLTQVAEQALANSQSRNKVKASDLKIASRQPIATNLSATAREESLAEAKRIATEIIEELRSEKQKGTLHRFDIQVKVDQGVIYLSGNVPDAEREQVVLEVANRASGVTQVVNELTIEEPHERSRTARHDDEVALAVVEELKSLKQSGRLRGFDVDVQVEQGAVWLSGYVADAQQQEMVLEATRYISGVKVVVNDLAIGSRGTVGRDGA